MQLHITDNVEKVLRRKFLFNRLQEDACLGLVQLTALDGVKQSELFVETFVKPTVDHIYIVVISPHQKTAQGAEYENELHQWHEMEGIVEHVQHRCFH